jgi:prepilin peptidase CpaA
MLHGVLLVVCLGALLAAAIHDLAARTIPNAFPLTLALAGIALRVAAGGLVGALAGAVLVFLLAAFCWLRGWLGGGDVKLLAAAALAVPGGAIPAFVLSVGLMGGLLALGYLLARFLVPAGSVRLAPASLPVRAWRAERWRIRRGGPLPYAVAIAAAGALALLHGGLT